MADKLEKRGPQDRARINVNETWEVDWWCKRWNITPAELKVAVLSVGVMASDVAKHLGKSREV
jgi:hypothetical protein